jgi:L-aminopeptidase/D-esterase-like protein
MDDAVARSVDLGDVLPGVTIGQWTDAEARTGCTVVLLPDGTVGSGEVRGGAPATREFELLAPERLVDRVHAVVLTGGSAFGLASADGVMSHLAARQIGFATPAGPVPIVVAMGLFDLLVGDGSVRPQREHGMLAADTASAVVELGPVGAGAGATVGTWRGIDHLQPAGLGVAVARRGDVCVAAIIAVNAFGDIDDPRDATALVDRIPDDGDPDLVFGNTTIGVIVTNARLDKTGCLLVAQSGHDGFARAIFPSHTRFDGDALVTCATGSLDREVAVEEVRLLAVAAVVDAIRSVAPKPPPPPEP